MLHLKLDDLIIDAQRTLPFDSFVFNGGEEHIRITGAPIEEVIIETSLTNSRKIMQLLMACNALRKMGFSKINLFAPYIPYSRQDRYCNPGEALSIKVMCALLNAQNFNKVWTLDNHSDVTSALLNHQFDIDVSALFERAVTFRGESVGLVCPDGGALKRTLNLSKSLGGLPIIECGKLRDTATGKIVKSVVHGLGVTVHDRLIMFDDICDGGRTFIELAKELKRVGCRGLELFVSHGIFSQGLEVLTNKETPYFGLFDRVYTTKSLKNAITDQIGVGFLMSDLLY